MNSDNSLTATIRFANWTTDSCPTATDLHLIDIGNFYHLLRLDTYHKLVDTFTPEQLDIIAAHGLGYRVTVTAC